jgi:hypothetical protein
VTLENDDLEELTGEIRRLIESNKEFLDKVNDEEFDVDLDDDEEEAASEDDDEYEEL